MGNELELMSLQSEVLFVHNEEGRLTRLNEFLHEDAPKVFVGRTKSGDVLRFREDLPDDLIAELSQIVARDKNNVDIVAMMHALETFEPVRRLWLGPAYVFQELFDTPSRAVLVTEENKHLLKSGFSNVLSWLDFRQPCYMMIEHERAVSVCFSSRQTEQAAEAGVETLEGYRGKGYALEVVTAWAAAIHESDRIPLYSTAWDNYASQAVANRLRLSRYGTDLSIY